MSALEAKRLLVKENVVRIVDANTLLVKTFLVVIALDANRLLVLALLDATRLLEYNKPDTVSVLSLASSDLSVSYTRSVLAVSELEAKRLLVKENIVVMVDVVIFLVTIVFDANRLLVLRLLDETRFFVYNKSDTVSVLSLASCDVSVS